MAGDTTTVLAYSVVGVGAALVLGFAGLEAYANYKETGNVMPTLSNKSNTYTKIGGKRGTRRHKSHRGSRKNRA